jgi:hypothetical protein
VHYALGLPKCNHGRNKIHRDCAILMHKPYSHHPAHTILLIYVPSRCFSMIPGPGVPHITNGSLLQHSLHLHLNMKVRSACTPQSTPPTYIYNLLTPHLPQHPSSYHYLAHSLPQQQPPAHKYITTPQTIMSDTEVAGAKGKTGWTDRQRVRHPHHYFHSTN